MESEKIFYFRYQTHERVLGGMPPVGLMTVTECHILGGYLEQTWLCIQLL